MVDHLEDKLRLPLFFCRVSLFLVYLAWTWDKLFNPSHGAGISSRHYGLDWVTPELMFAVGVAELAFILVFLLGFLKRPVRALIIVLSLISAFGPLVRTNYIGFLKATEDTPLDRVSDLYHAQYLLPTLCMVVAAIIVYALRDYDTLFSFSKKDRALKA